MKLLRSTTNRVPVRFKMKSGRVGDFDLVRKAGGDVLVGWSDLLIRPEARIALACPVSLKSVSRSGAELVASAALRAVEPGTNCCDGFVSSLSVERPAPPLPRRSTGSVPPCLITRR